MGRKNPANERYEPRERTRLRPFTIPTRCAHARPMRLGYRFNRDLMQYLCRVSDTCASRATSCHLPSRATMRYTKLFYEPTGSVWTGCLSVCLSVCLCLRAVVGWVCTPEIILCDLQRARRHKQPDSKNHALERRNRVSRHQTKDPHAWKGRGANRRLG